MNWLSTGSSDFLCCSTAFWTMFATAEYVSDDEFIGVTSPGSDVISYSLGVAKVTAWLQLHINLHRFVPGTKDGSCVTYFHVTVPEI